MDRQELLELYLKNYLPRVEVLSCLPLNIDINEFWTELIEFRKCRAVVLPLKCPGGGSYWYVPTEKMILASNRLCKEALAHAGRFDPYSFEVTPDIATAMSQEAYFTSFLEGADYSLDEAVAFLTGGTAPENIYEQNILNNYQAWSYLLNTLTVPWDHENVRALIEGLAKQLTAGPDSGTDIWDGTAGFSSEPGTSAKAHDPLLTNIGTGGMIYRHEDWTDNPLMSGEPYTVPAACDLPTYLSQLYAFLLDTSPHPLVRAAVTQAWIIAIRPFPEGNDRLGRLLSSLILTRCGYDFLLDASISAFISRESFRYVKALRASVGTGDLTYFLEYYVDLLSRVMAEQKREKQLVQPFPMPPKGIYTPGTWEKKAELYTEEDIACMLNAEYVTVDEGEQIVFWQQLAAMEASYSRPLNQTAILLKQFLAQKRTEFTMLEIREALHLSHDQASNIRAAFVRRNIAKVVRNVGYTTGGYRGIYRFTIYGDGPQTAEEAREEEASGFRSLWEEGQEVDSAPEAIQNNAEGSYEVLFERIGKQVKIEALSEKMDAMLRLGKWRFTSMEWAKAQGSSIQIAQHDLRKLYAYGLADRVLKAGKYVYTLTFATPEELADLYNNGDGLALSRTVRLGIYDFWSNLKAVEESNSNALKRLVRLLGERAKSGDCQFTMKEVATELGLTEQETHRARGTMLNWHLVTVIGYISTDTATPVGLYKLNVEEDKILPTTGTAMLVTMREGSGRDAAISEYLSQRVRSGDIVITADSWAKECGVDRAQARRYIKKAFLLGLLNRIIVGEDFAYEIKTEELFEDQQA